MLTMCQVLRATDTNRDKSSTDPTTRSEQCQVAVKILGGGTEGGGWQDPDSETLPSEGETPEDNFWQTEVYFSQSHRGCMQRGWKDRAEAQVLRCVCLADLRLDSQQRRKEGQKKRRKQRKVGGKVTLEEAGPFGRVPLPIPKPKQDRHHQRRFLL